MDAWYYVFDAREVYVMSGGPRMTVPGIAMTPKLRDALLGGQPLFQEA